MKKQKALAIAVIVCYAAIFVFGAVMALDMYVYLYHTDTAVSNAIEAVIGSLGLIASIIYSVLVLPSIFLRTFSLFKFRKIAVILCLPIDFIYFIIHTYIALSGSLKIWELPVFILAAGLPPVLNIISLKISKQHNA